MTLCASANGRAAHFAFRTRSLTPGVRAQIYEMDTTMQQQDALPTQSVTMSASPVVGVEM